MPECLVCFADYWVANTPCNHFICIECIFKIKKDECPMCRRQLLYTIPTKIQTFMQLDKNTMNNNNHSSVDIHNMNEFPPLT